jgi:hypothetical protein
MVSPLTLASARADVGDFAGHYWGTYATNDLLAQRGTWCASVDGQGRIDGSVHSDVTGQDYALAGTVSETGDMVMSTGETADDSAFVGSVTAEGGVAGTWNSVRAPDRWNGTFEGGRVETPATPCGAPSA